MKRVFAISAGLILAWLLVGTAAGEEVTEDRTIRLKPRTYGYIYNADCLDTSKKIPGCYNRVAGWQICRFLPTGHSFSTSLPICPRIKQATQNQSIKSEKPLIDAIKREKRDLSEELKKKLSEEYKKKLREIAEKFKKQAEEARLKLVENLLKLRF